MFSKNKCINIQKTVWRSINNEVGVKEMDTVGNITLTERGQTISVPKFVANIFIDHFNNLVEDLGIKSHDDFEYVSVTSCNRSLGNSQIIKPRLSIRLEAIREVDKIIYISHKVL